ncbi:YL1 nuclear protein-domain-containing protein [Epithele typhae]|uniref:YL1 nuclear protein-domain-containing protein n=1 Tax=Epithele typhae TaxID=378194 RepID=UPI002007D669|nr:YL1 nuclear protein-domain-containing protein [Epithele typhae]KAH9939033.1 YL1 nuclear protein-domain-containing protein [Epithele typhae]
MDESLISRRPKRSTAGNRMEAALAEFKEEDLGMDVEEDEDFAIGKDEEDLFESDFESTDEEGAQEDVDAVAEKLIRQEESQVRKTSRTQLERVTALAHARQAATFNPAASAPPPPEKPKGEKKLNRRVSLGFAVNAETGEVLEAGGEADEASTPVSAIGRRHSLRAQTLANTSATFSRARDEVRKQSSIPKRAKVVVKAPTQAELIAQALDMEEGNIDEHKNYLANEEEKRKRARVVRQSVQGPLLRWVSKKDEDTILVQPPAPPPPPPAPAPPPPNPYMYYYAPPIPYPPNANPSPFGTVQFTPGPMFSSPDQQLPFPQWPPPPPPPAFQNVSSMTTTFPVAPPTIAPTPGPSFALPPVPSSSAPPPFEAPPPVPPEPAPAPPPIEKKVDAGKQFVVHELSQGEKATRPLWANTMNAMFGENDWENMRVYTSKGRPLARPTQTCAITGRPAKYLDPRTNTPFASLEAYLTIGKIMRHEYTWNPVLECYVGQEGSIFANNGI